jgi:hypothetical protein
MMSILYIIIVVVLLCLVAMLFRAVGNFVYYMLLHDIIRIPFVVVSLFFLFLIVFSNKFEKIQLLTGIACFAGFYSYFFERFYYSYRNFFNSIVNIIFKILKIGHKTGRFLVDVKTGVHNSRKQLELEKEEFENQKQWFEEERKQQEQEWENIYREWERIKEEREKSGNYQETKESYQKERKEHKTGWSKPKSPNLPQEQYDLLVRLSRFNLEKIEDNDPYEVFEMNRNITKEEALVIARKLYLVIHPDKIKPFGSEEEIELATHVFRLVKAMRDKIEVGL